MLKIILIWGVGLTSLAIMMGVFVVIFEHIQHKKMQAKYDDLHRRMGLSADTDDPPMNHSPDEQ